MQTRLFVGGSGHFRSRFGRVIVAVNRTDIVAKFTRFYTIQIVRSRRKKKQNKLLLDWLNNEIILIKSTTFAVGGALFVGP